MSATAINLPTRHFVRWLIYRTHSAVSMVTPSVCSVTPRISGGVGGVTVHDDRLHAELDRQLAEVAQPAMG